MTQTSTVFTCPHDPPGGSTEWGRSLLFTLLLLLLLELSYWTCRVASVEPVTHDTNLYCVHMPTRPTRGQHRVLAESAIYPVVVVRAIILDMLRGVCGASDA